ncbi:hypothetical protein SERLA73DRAFT_191340 [Serpula lacrymans var. lacrymans S7.3]|uniref:Uncharacterized protein n=1 Tax=Serpula lacrymans var. lacrymans (strain S7.3) TaxID=936435 RepID=F8QHB7_SERL3|nr:hypothetical protein SERLA73DRAFT_191340 [Serpula lacrymans var. lacrymans S7.3]
MGCGPVPKPAAEKPVQESEFLQWKVGREHAENTAWKLFGDNQSSAAYSSLRLRSFVETWGMATVTLSKWKRKRWKIRTIAPAIIVPTIRAAYRILSVWAMMAITSPSGPVRLGRRACATLWQAR